MFIPKDILNLIYDYKNQLELLDINKEFKKKVYYKYSSPYFSQIIFDNNVVSFYRGTNQVLTKIKNTNIRINGFYVESVIQMLD
jgi:hypothetical protein